jgi:hypothetical protein
MAALRRLGSVELVRPSIVVILGLLLLAIFTAGIVQFLVLGR